MKKQMVKIIKNKMPNVKGFSLVEVVISIGILAIAILSVSAVYTYLNKAENGIADKLTTNEFINALSKHLTTKSTCDLSLTGQPVPIVGVDTDIVISPYDGYGSNSTNKIKANSVLSPRLKVNKISIKDKGIPKGTVSFKGENYNRIISQIKIVLDLKSDGVVTQIVRFIELPILTKVSPGPASGKIDSCGLEATTSDVCVNMGGTFDSDTNVCTPKPGNCEFRGIAYGCLPTTTCPGPGINFPSARFFTHPSSTSTAPAAACTRGGTPTSTGEYAYTYTTGSGKSLKTFNNKAYFYICLECP